MSCPWPVIDSQLAEYLKSRHFSWLVADLCQPILNQHSKKRLNLPSMHHITHGHWRKKAEAQPWIYTKAGKKPKPKERLIP